MHAIERITDRITLVLLTIGIWSGRKKLRAEDLKLGTEVPPEDLVSLGSKRVCNPESLKVFNRLKKGAERACLRGGTRFLGGFAIPNGRADAVADELDEIKAEFEQEAGQFLQSYEQDLEDWIVQHPRWEGPIRRAIEPANVVGGRLRFGYQLIQIAPADKSGTLVEEVKGLGDGVFAEVAQVARELDESFLGKEVLHRRALGTFRIIREKLDCLSFIDPRIQPIVDTIDDWFRRLPVKGPIAGGIFNEGWSLASLLGDPDKLARHGAGQWALQHGQDSDDDGTNSDDEASAPAAPTEPEPACEASSVSSVDDDDLEALFGDLEASEPTPEVTQDGEDDGAEVPEVRPEETTAEETTAEETREPEPALAEDQSFFF